MDGRLRQFFSGVGFKRLTAVECYSAGVSNQHELGASAKMRTFLGQERNTFRCSYFYFGGTLGEDGAFLEEDSWITYYDAREHAPHRSAEYRLTYPAGNSVMDEALPGDYCWLAQVAAEPNTLLLVVAQADTAVANQLDRLFGTDMRLHGGVGMSSVLAPADLTNAGDSELTIDDSSLLGLLNVPVVMTFDALLERVIDRFGGFESMPKVKPFCDFVRQLCPGVDETTGIDEALHRWFVFTNEMFLGLERHVIGPKLDLSFANRDHIDVEMFFQVSRKYQQSRFSRAGLSWELHLSAAFEREAVRFEHNRQRLIDGTKPDFLFPSREAYLDDIVPQDLLTFVGAKTTAKERWLQLVGEGHHPGERFLATMDRDLTPDVLVTMSNKQVIPVLPSTFVVEHYGYSPSGILSFSDLVALIREREATLLGLQLID